MSWLDFTTELKSTYSFRMMPEIWLPTCTLTTGLNCPVAVTTCWRLPRATGAVWYWAEESFLAAKYQMPAPAAAPSTARMRIHFRHRKPLLFAIKIIQNPAPFTRPRTGAGRLLDSE